MKKIITIMLALLCMGSLFATGAKEFGPDESLEYIKGKGNLILGLDDSFPPMGYRDENNEIVGFDIDVAREVCSRLGVLLVLQPIDWNAKEQELATKQIDCIWNGFTVTEERKKTLTFSDPYVNNAQVVIVLNDSPYQTLDDLKGKTVGLQAGSSAADALEDSPEFKASIKGVVELKDNLTALMDLEAGGCDAVIMDLLVANYAIKQSAKPMRILKQGLAQEEYAVGFRLGENALATAVNNAMKAMVADGTMANIANKWFGADITVIGK
ncbi:MAG: amino acid ABC transporter substrate-binding protein [Spirochaetales bacterium]|nr:amino acid ABC transporter substrate-binding protein [Spirochaetales bacterium]